MRRRLLALSVTLVGLVLVALTVPLVTTYAEDRTQDLFVNRLGHVTRFAVLAENALEAGDAAALDADLERYAEVYGGSVIVTNANREVVARTGRAGSGDPEVAEVVEDALAGRPSTPPPTAWPWSTGSVVIGSPVGRDAQVLGAVVLVAPTASVQDSVTTWLLWLTIGGLAVLLLTVFGLVAPFVGWVMRPVHDLDAAARRLAGGDLASRAHQTGPPELRTLAGSFNTMADNVEVSQQQQRDLVADAAHQLGNPLTSLRLRIEGLGATALERAEVQTVLEEADRLSTIVGSLLDLSQVGAHVVTPVPTDVAAQARHRCEMWAPVFTELRVDAPGQVLAASTDGLVDVVLDALLDNAAKFAPGAPVQVEVGAVADEVLLRVRDHGPGLAVDDVAKVGDRFFRGREHQNVAGTGLGLAIVRARVRDAGGRVEVGLADGGGLAVSVWLPRVRAGSGGSSAAPPDAGRPVR
ncbi:sensor histidine kinase [Nocardioides mesophilus]|uniref:histidine kinase n=1 Tax=Nocardioides mesophilus TaxID=433659 RepID=A0A7G9R9M3_9ACTN|nr:HAMP domain-containing sensor histidine kinase [Nocardioides mesophilus]QNN52298.1 HAMP domain-containing histidine kinase [Nocardioides mesophilus]